MFDVVFRWNACRPDLESNDFVDTITLRGYNSKDVGLTGEFITKLHSKQIRELSVGDITSKICPKGRDVYLRKGPRQIKAKDGATTWGRETGKFIEQYYYDLFPRGIKTHKQKYISTQKQADKYSRKFFNSKAKKIDEITDLEESSNIRDGDTKWLINIMKQSCRAEIAIKILNRLSKDSFNIDLQDIKIKAQINSKIEVTGISARSEPDFIAPKHKIIGDIKTGERFEDYYPLTCAGYALAYENEFETDINWGAIYFVPKYTNSEYFNVITYPQIHFFPIDEKLREWFLENRDEAYNIISNKDAPGFPNDLTKCPSCKYKSHCVEEGLVLKS